jgi:hypothetical protein
MSRAPARALRLFARRGFAPDAEAARDSRSHRCWPASRASVVGQIVLGPGAVQGPRRDGRKVAATSALKALEGKGPAPARIKSQFQKSIGVPASGILHAKISESPRRYFRTKLSSVEVSATL